MKTAEAIAKIIKETQGVAKNKEVGFGQNKYKARTIEDVLDMVRDKCAENGLVFIPTNIKSTNWVDTRIDKNNKERKVQVCDIEAEYVITTGEDTIQGSCVGRGEDSGDKSPGKAMTYAYKNLLVQTFMLATNDTDPDLHASEENFVSDNTASKDQINQVKGMAKELTPNELVGLSQWKIDNMISPIIYGEFLKVDVKKCLDEIQRIIDSRV